MPRSLAWLLLALLLPMTAGAASQGEYFEGVHYKRIDPPAPTEAAEGKVEVVELFWYGCPHCFEFDPMIEEWRDEAKPEAAAFRRVPATLNPRWKVHARAFYAAKVLGVQDEIHTPLFKGIHEQRRRLNSLESIARFLERQGVDRKEFLDAARSLEVDMAMRRADRLNRAYQAGGVPTMIVDGRYRTSASLAGDYRTMLDVVDHLVAKRAD